MTATNEVTASQAAQSRTPSDTLVALMRRCWALTMTAHTTVRRAANTEPRLKPASMAAGRSEKVNGELHAPGQQHDDGGEGELEEERQGGAAVVDVGDRSPRPVGGVGDEHDGAEQETEAGGAEVGPGHHQADADGHPAERRQGRGGRLGEAGGAAVAGLGVAPIGPTAGGVAGATSLHAGARRSPERRHCRAAAGLTGRTSGSGADAMCPPG